MIRLTRLGGDALLLNAELIQYVESRPDTFITLVNGERLVVVEAMDEVLRRVMWYQQAKHMAPPPAGSVPTTRPRRLRRPTCRTTRDSTATTTASRVRTCRMGARRRRRGRSRLP